MTVLMIAVWISIMILILGLLVLLSFFAFEVTEYAFVGVVTFIVLTPIGIFLSVAFGTLLGVLK